jgi:uncharacterized membrane protein YkvA (DUF1232 family)
MRDERPTAFRAWIERADELELEVHALYPAVRDGRTPLAAKGAIALTVAHAVSPIGPIPAVIPGLGHLDELVVVPVGVAIAYELTPDSVPEECRERSNDELAAGRARWIAAGVVLLVWFVLRVLAISTVTNRV